MIGFALREGWRNFSHLSIYGLLTLLALTGALTLGGAAWFTYRLIGDWRSGMLNRLEIEAFLDPELPDTVSACLKPQIEAILFVDSTRFIPKDSAAVRYASQFGVDIFADLGANPLPASYLVTLSENADPSVAWARVAASLKSLPGVEDVVYQGELLAAIHRFYRRFYTIAGGMLGLFLTLAVTFSALTVNAEIKTRAEFIRVILLSGGSSRMARSPFWAMGFYYGLFSGIVAAVIVAALIGLVGVTADPSLKLDYLWLSTLPAAGVVIGTGGAAWAAGRRIQLK